VSFEFVYASREDNSLCSSLHSFFKRIDIAYTYANKTLLKLLLEEEHLASRLECVKPLTPFPCQSLQISDPLRVPPDQSNSTSSSIMATYSLISSTWRNSNSAKRRNESCLNDFRPNSTSPYETPHHELTTIRSRMT